jgi:hypothetical protein
VLTTLPFEKFQETDFIGFDNTLQFCRADGLQVFAKNDAAT